MGNTSNRHVCLLSKQTTQQILLHYSLHAGLEDRCFCIYLGRKGPVHISTLFTDIQGHPEDSERLPKDHCGDSLLTQASGSTFLVTLTRNVSLLTYIGSPPIPILYYILRVGTRIIRKKALVKGQLMRLAQMVSDDECFKEEWLVLKDMLLKRG